MSQNLNHISLFLLIVTIYCITLKKIQCTDFILQRSALLIAPCFIEIKQHVWLFRKTSRFSNVPLSRIIKTFPLDLSAYLPNLLKLTPNSISGRLDSVAPICSICPVSIVPTLLTYGNFFFISFLTPPQVFWWTIFHVTILRCQLCCH